MRAEVPLFLCILSAFCSADYLIRTRDFQQPATLDDEHRIIATIPLPPYLILQPDGSYTGFLPDLLKYLGNYTLDVKNDTDIGGFENNTWTGIIGDVASFYKTAHMAAGPITDNVQTSYFKYVIFSRPWSSVGVNLVVKKSSNISSLTYALNHHASFVIVADSIEDKMLTNGKNLSNLVAALQDRLQNATKTTDISEGLQEVSTHENRVMILNSLDAIYYVGRHFCSDFKIIDDNIFSLGSYAFAIQPTFTSIKAEVNSAISALEANSTLAALRKKWWNPPGVCSSTVSQHVTTQFSTNLIALIVLTVVVSSHLRTSKF